MNEQTILSAQGWHSGFFEKVWLPWEQEVCLEQIDFYRPHGPEQVHEGTEGGYYLPVAAPTPKMTHWSRKGIPPLWHPSHGLNWQSLTFSQMAKKKCIQGSSNRVRSMGKKVDLNVRGNKLITCMRRMTLIRKIYQLSLNYGEPHKHFVNIISLISPENSVIAIVVHILKMN